MRGLILLHLLILLCGTGCERSAPFHLERFVQQGSGTVRLNEPLVLRFSREIDPSSINEDTVAVLDAGDRRAVGDWQVKGKTLRFIPRIPREPDGADAGLEPDQAYTVHLVGFPAFLGIRSTEGDHLDRGYRLPFRTVPPRQDLGELFVDPCPESGPVLVAVMGIPMEDLGAEGVDVMPGWDLTLTFSEPLYPPSLSAGGGKINMIIDGGNRVDTLDLLSRYLDERPDGWFVAIHPQGGFVAGRKYRLFRESLGFTDFGGKGVEKTFNFIWINCVEEIRK